MSVKFETVEERSKEVEDALKIEYELLNYDEYMAKEKKGDEYWATAVMETKERIREIITDYLNYINGGEGYISGYLETIYEIEKNQQNEKERQANC